MNREFELALAFVDAGDKLYRACYSNGRSISVRVERSCLGPIVAAAVNASRSVDDSSRYLSCEWHCRHSEDFRAAIMAAVASIGAGPDHDLVDAVVDAYAALRGEVR